MLSSIFFNKNKNFINNKNNYFSNKIKSNILLNNFDYKQIIKESNNKYVDKILQSIENNKNIQCEDNKFEIIKSNNLNLYLSISISITILLFSFNIFKR